MNLWVAAVNPSRSLRERVLGELAATALPFPELDASTAWVEDACEQVTLGSVHSADRSAAPRRPVHRGQGRITLSDGVLVDPRGRIAAHDAEALDAHWGDLPERLEGRFVAVRAAAPLNRLEVLMDPLGMYPVFEARDGETRLLSGSAALLLHLAGRRDLDPLGAGQFVALGWPAGDRTLWEGVRVLPGGRRYTFDPGRAVPHAEPFFSVPELARRRARNDDEGDRIARAGEELAKIVAAVFALFPETECPLTGGRDSRLLLALCLQAGIRPRVHTRGRPGDADVATAAALARQLGLEHEIREEGAAEVAACWDVLCRRLLDRTDGMVGLWQVADVLEKQGRRDHLGFTLGGIGGEICRRYYRSPTLDAAGVTPDEAIPELLRILLKKRGALLTGEAHAAVKRSLEELLADWPARASRRSTCPTCSTPWSASAAGAGRTPARSRPSARRSPRWSAGPSCAPRLPSIPCAVSSSPSTARSSPPRRAGWRRFPSAMRRAPPRSSGGCAACSQAGAARSERRKLRPCRRCSSSSTPHCGNP